jgi:phytoene dehydrogenase-like protein
VIVGAGPNGLAAANVLVDAGQSVTVFEAEPNAGGGSRSAALTEPGFVHDICSAIHPLGVASPCFRELGLERHGLRFRWPAIHLAHPFDDGTAAALHSSLDATAETLLDDGDAWKSMMRPFVDEWGTLLAATLRPIRDPRPLGLLARFGSLALRSSDALVRARFTGGAARALFGGAAAHSLQPLGAPGTASFGLMLLLAGHSVGWPCAEGGSQAIADALVRRLVAGGGELRLGTEVTSLDDLPRTRVVLFDLTPAQVARIAKDALPSGYVRRLERYRYGPGVFKLDWSLDAPIPWRAEACRRAGTVHVVGSYAELAASERAIADGRIPEKPFVLVAQQSCFDESRAPAPRHTGWAYCHVPNGASGVPTSNIEAQIERFAPGFRDLVRARHAMGPAEFEAHDANLVGGDIGGGSNDLWQFLFRPFPRRDPYATPNPRIFLCSSSTPPGGGVHGMCGYWAARSALTRLGV